MHTHTVTQAQMHTHTVTQAHTYTKITDRYRCTHTHYHVFIMRGSHIRCRLLVPKIKS
jgi:hypothetical protein